jgi:hypothetical protein
MISRRRAKMIAFINEPLALRKDMQAVLFLHKPIE